MPNYSDTTLNQLIINQLTKSQYEQIVPDPNQLYFVDGEEIGCAFYAEYNVTPFADIKQAYEDGRTIFCKYNDAIYPLRYYSWQSTFGTATFSGFLPDIAGSQLQRTITVDWYSDNTTDWIYADNNIVDEYAVTDVTVNGTTVLNASRIAVFSQATAITALSTATVAVPNSITTTSSATAITALSTATFTPKTGVSSTSASAITALSTGTFTPKTGINVTGSATAITSLATGSFTPKTGISVTASIDAITALNSASITPVTGNTVLNSATYSSGVLTLGSGNAVTTGTAVYFATPTPKKTASALQTITLTNGTAINYVTGASTTDTFVKSVSLTDGTAITYVNGASTTDTFLKTVTLTNGTAITYVSAASATDTFLKTVSLATSNITYVSGASSTKSFIIKP